jgi:hypothetical protein
MDNRLKNSVLSSQESMNISNTVIEPIIINNTTCRFILEKKGTLDIGSIIQLAVKCNGAVSGQCYLPIKTGIHSLIKRAVLKIGDKVIDTLNLNAQYQTIKTSFKTVEEKSLIDMVKTGVVSAVCPSNQGDGLLQLRDVNYTTPTASQPLEFIRITSSDTTTPLFSVKLSDLFKLLNNVPLPLQMINDPVSIEIEFNTQAGVNADEGNVCMFNEGTVEAEKIISVSTVNCKALINYLAYGPEMTKETLRHMTSKEGINYMYETVISIPTNFPAVGVPPVGVPSTREIVRNLGLNSMLLKSVLVFLHFPGTHSLLGKYSSDAYHIEDSYNVRLNDGQYLSQDVKNNCLKSYYLSEVFSQTPFIHNAEYSFDIATDKTTVDHTDTNNPFCLNTMAGYSQEDLLGSQYYIGVSMDKGIQIEQKPVEFLHKITDISIDYQGREVVYFASVEKVMNLRNGEVSMVV